MGSISEEFITRFLPPYSGPALLSREERGGAKLSAISRQLSKPSAEKLKADS
jgi:hypothetical protein